MSDYQNLTFRMVDIGLDLRDVVDKVPEGKWTRLTNVRSTQEAQLSTREGRTLAADYTGEPSPIVHSIKRLGPTSILVGVGHQLFKNASPFTEPLNIPIGFSGDPLGLVTYRTEGSPSPWIFVADSVKMRKVNDDGQMFQWGISPPNEIVSFTSVGAGNGNLDSTVPGAVGYDWRATYFNSNTGSESNPTNASGATLSGAGFVAHLSIAGSTDPQVTQVRFYRRGGTITNAWRLAVTASNVPGGLVEADDNQADSAILQSKPISINNDVPFTSVSANGSQVFSVAMPYIAGPFLGKYIFACGDPNRRGYLYWTNADNPDGASQANNVQITHPTEPLNGIFLYDGRPFVFSTGNLYEVEFGQTAATFRGRLTTCGRGLAAPWCFAVGPEIYFLSGDGIYSTVGDQPARSITDDSLRPIFQGQSIGDLGAVDWRYLGLDPPSRYLRLFYAGQDLHFLYKDVNGVYQHLVWSSQYQRWKRLIHAGQSISAGYATENIPEAQLYLGTRTGQVYYTATASSLDGTNTIPTTDAGTVINVNARTGSIDFGMPQTYKELGDLIIDADAKDTSIILNMQLNGETSNVFLGEITGASEGRRKYVFSLQNRFVYSFALDLTWNGPATVYQIELLWRPDEEDIVNWSFPPTSHGLSGWQQLRDIYLATRNTEPLVLTILADDQADTYTVPSTGGLKKKQNIHLKARKGKLFSYFLVPGSVAPEVPNTPFRIYGEDCEARVKVWNTNMGYDLVSVFKNPGA